MTNEDRARMWDVVRNQRLFIVPPGREGATWLARTIGGVHDKRPKTGVGMTPEEAVANIKDWEELA